MERNAAFVVVLFKFVFAILKIENCVTNNFQTFKTSKYDVKELNMKCIHVLNGMYLKVRNRASNRRFHNRWIDSCVSVESAIVQTLNWLDGCTSVDSTVARTSIRRLQASNQRLHKSRIEGWTSVKSTIGQASNRRLYWLF